METKNNSFIEENKLKDLMDKMTEIELSSLSKSEYDIQGKRVPRVTEVLSAMISEPSLMNWSNGLGWKRISYRAFMKEAADKGTYSHLAIQKYLENDFLDLNTLNIPDNIRDTVVSVMDGFISWWTQLHKSHKTIEVVYLEETLIHKYFGGTCDCLLKVDDQYWLIDFKTSNHMNYNYALQLSAYKFLLKELKDIDVQHYMILRLSKTDHNYTTYELDESIEEHRNFINDCLQTFMILSAAFRMRLTTTDKYHEIFNTEKKK